MNSINYINRFWKMGMLYLGWGAACGSASLGLALMAGLNQGLALGAMGAGVVTWSVLCAVFAVKTGFGERAMNGVWARAWRLGLWIRAGLTLTGVALMGLGWAIPSCAGWWLCVVAPDFIAGAISISLTRGVFGGFPGCGAEFPGGFFPIYLTTLVQGAWVVASILVFTGIIRCLLRDDEKAVASRGVDTDAAPL